jgi:exodeoxyribonuclease VIII
MAVIQEQHTKPRVMSFAEYSAIDAEHWSTLREMDRSPAHYRYRLDHPREDSTRLGFGRGAHAALFEPDRFAVFKGPKRAGKAWQAFKAVHAAETILKATEYEHCIGIRDAVRAHETAAGFLRGGLAEHVIVWTDPETGLTCKARPDYLSDALLELKTTDDLARFSWFVEEFGYHCQVAFYLMALRAIGIRVPARIIAVECRPPHKVALVALAAARLEAGELECRRLLRQVAACRAARSWPEVAVSKVG